MPAFTRAREQRMSVRTACCRRRRPLTPVARLLSLPFVAQRYAPLFDVAFATPKPRHGTPSRRRRSRRRAMPATASYNRCHIRMMPRHPAPVDARCYYTTSLCYARITQHTRERAAAYRCYTIRCAVTGIMFCAAAEQSDARMRARALPRAIATFKKHSGIRKASSQDCAE